MKKIITSVILYLLIGGLLCGVYYLISSLFSDGNFSVALFLIAIISIYYYFQMGYVVRCLFDIN